MSPRITLISLFIFCVACTPKPETKNGSATPNTSSSAPESHLPQADGTVNGGGGNLDPSTVVNQQGIESFAKSKLPELLKMFFNYGRNPAIDVKPLRFAGIRHSSEKDQLSISVAEKLYLKSETIFDKLSTAKIVVQEEACIDPQTKEEKDGSATGNSICLSSGRLANRYTVNEYQKSILALAAHEYSHLLGTNESEAKYLEAQALSIVKLDSRLSNSLDDRLTDMRIQLGEAVERIESAQNPSLSAVATCLRLQRIRESVGILKEATFYFEQTFGLSVLEPKQQALIWTATLKSVNLTAFCKSTSIGTELEKDQVYDGFSASESKIDLSLYRSRIGIPNHGEVGSISKLSDGNLSALSLELAELTSALKEALTLVSQY